MKKRYDSQFFILLVCIQFASPEVVGKKIHDQKDCVASLAEDTWPIYQNDGLRHKTNRLTTSDTPASISGQASLVLSRAGVVLQGAPSRKSARRIVRKHGDVCTRICVEGDRYRDHCLRGVCSSENADRDTGDRHRADDFPRDRSKPQPRRINYVSSVIRLMPLYIHARSHTESEFAVYVQY